MDSALGFKCKGWTSWASKRHGLQNRQEQKLCVQTASSTFRNCFLLIFFLLSARKTAVSGYLAFLILLKLEKLSWEKGKHRTRLKIQLWYYGNILLVLHFGLVVVLFCRFVVWLLLLLIFFFNFPFPFSLLPSPKKKGFNFSVPSLLKSMEVDFCVSF